mgnify:CR=1 FL=1
MDKQIIENSFFYLVNECAKELKKELYTELEKNGLSLPIEQFNVLTFVSEHKDVKQQEIADATGKDKTTITRFLDVMIKKKLLYKKDSKIDSRQKLISISKNGKEVLEKTLTITNRFNQNIESKFDKKELQTLKKNLKNSLELFNQETLF